MIEILAREAVFHFNKKHLQDPTIPMWVVKAKGETFYVNHVECNVPWSTKETSDNPHTKGSIKIKRCRIKIDDDNCALIYKSEDEVDLPKIKYPIRIITEYGTKLATALAYNAIPHGPIRVTGGGCGTAWYITELEDKDDFANMMLSWDGGAVRILAINEPYYLDYKPGDYHRYETQFGPATAEFIDEEEEYE